MYGEISPRAAKRYSLAEFTDALRHGPGDGDGGQGDDRRSLRGRVRGPAGGGRAGQPRDPRLRADLRPPRCCRWPATGSPGRRTSSSRGSGPESVSCGARGSPSGPRSWPETGRRWPRGRPRAAPRRLARPPRASPARSPRPSPEQDRELSRLGFPPGTPTGTSGLELAFDRRLAGRPGGQLVAVASDGGNPPSGGPVLASSKPARGQARARDHRPRPPAGRGGGARRPVRRRRRAGRPRRLGAGAGGDRLLRPSAAGLDLQGDHDHRGARGGGRRAHGPVPDPDLDRGRRPRGRQRPQRGLWRQLRRGLREVVQQRLRPARPQDRLGAPGRGGRAATASTRPRASSTTPPFGP